MPRALVWGERVINYKTAIFRQVNQDKKWVHHDALEFPDGEIVLLTFLQEGQRATVLQLPASAGVKAEQRNEPATAVGSVPICTDGQPVNLYQILNFVRGVR